MQKKTRTLLSVLLAGTLLLGAVSAAAADSTASTNTQTAIKNLWHKFQGNKPQTSAQVKTEVSTQLKALVEKGTITQAQADKVMVYLEKEQETRQAEAEKIKNMTEAERKAFIEQNKNNCQDWLAQLVTDKVLSQEQADTVAKVLPMHRGHGMNGHKMGQQGDQTKMKEVLSGLVTKGTITQTQMDNILSAMEKIRTEHQAAMDKMKNTTESQRQAYMQQYKSGKQDLISQLIQDKVITSEQAQAIRNALPQRPQNCSQNR